MKLIFLLLIYFSSIQFILGQVSINKDGLPITDTSAMLEIKKAKKSKLKIRNTNYNDTTELQLSNRTTANIGTDFNFRSIAEQGLFISTSSDLPINTNDSLMILTTRGNVGIGGLPHNNAVLDLKSSTKGVLFPRLSTAQRKAIINPDIGLMVFDTDKNSLFLFDGASWQGMIFTNPMLIPAVERKANDFSPNSAFGMSVCISGDYSVIGAPYAGAGAAYIFHREGGIWSQQSKLIPSDGSAGDRFGISVSISGDYVIIGSHNARVGLNTRQGAAYIFFRIGTIWSQQAKLLALDGNADDEFGSAVCISGTNAIVGAPKKEIGANDHQGAAYIYSRTGISWPQQQRIFYFAGSPEDRFGNAVSISGTNLIVGADGENISRGAVYFFSYNVTTGWTFLSEVISPHHSPLITGGNFGNSVSISGNYAVVGAYNEGDFGQGAAYVYFFSGGTWTYHAQIYDPGSQPFASFGSSVFIDNDNVIIGSMGGNTTGYTGQGFAYVFNRSGTNWRFVRKIADPLGVNNDALGVSCAINGFNLIVGAYYADQVTGKVLFVNIE